MFRKKRASTSPNLSNPNPTPSAATAAAQAFVKKQTQDANLSNAAAAAALRSHSTSPAPVGDLQTKRMVRKGSTSSAGSDAASQRPGLQRQGSQGSLTQRSFRSPPPAQADDIPPVPVLPGESSQISKDSRPPPPMQSDPTRSGKAPQVDNRPWADSKGGIPSGLDESIWASAHQKTPQAMNRKSRLSLDSPRGSPKSINFSRPMSPSNSPQSPRTTKEGFQPIPTPTNVPSASRRETPSETVPQASTNHQGTGQTSTAQTHQGKRLIARSMHQPPSGNAVDPSVAGNKSQGAPSSAAGPQASTSRGSGFLVALKESQTAANDSTASSSRKKKLRSSSDVQGPSAVGVEQVTTSALQSQPATKPNTIPSATPEQIKAYQSRAAAMLARPLMNEPSPESTSLRSYEDNYSVQKFELSNNNGNQTAPKSTTNDDRRVASQPVHDVIGRTMSLGRAESLSPARSAHFLDAPQVESTKHQPPARSVSPVKSAMKTPSPRNMSPEILQIREHSDHSDSRSLVSEESSTTGAPKKKKKKSARVSFEDNPVTVGEAAEGGTSLERGPLSPQFRAPLRDAETDAEEISMAPRPILPSFGSIRERKIQESHDENQTPDDSGLLNQTNADGSDGSSDDEQNRKEVESHDFAEHKPSLHEDEASNLLAPTIAVQPATPRLEESNQFETQNSRGDDRGVETSSDSPKSPVETSHGTDLALRLQADAPTTQVPQEGENSSDNGSDDSDVFSDAAEDPSEFEEPGGFASLDAIVESPVGEAGASTKASNSSDVETYDAKPLEERLVSTTPDGEGEWDVVRSYWNSLSEQRRQEIEREARSQRFEPASYDSTVPGVELAKESNSSAAVVSADKPLANSKGKQKSPTKPTAIPLKPAIKKTGDKTMVEQAKPEQIHLRKSMRSSGTIQRASMSEAPRFTSKQQPHQAERQPRPTSADASSAQKIAMSIYASRPKSLTGFPEMGGQSSKQQFRRGSNDSSASDSSFKRKRRGSTSTTGSAKYTMRRSMRGSSPPPLPTSPRLSSPVGFSRKSLLHSERDSSARPKSSSGLFGLAKSSKSGKAAKSKNAKSKGSSFSASSRFQSRFVDSDDDDEDVRPMYSSRFPDSDDSGDEATAGPASASSRKWTPLRSIPRRADQEDGDSTDLPDSGEEGAATKRTSPKKKGVAPKGRPATPPAQDLLGLAKNNHVSISGGLNDKFSPPSTLHRAVNVNPNGSTRDGPLNVGTLHNSSAGAALSSASQPGDKSSNVDEMQKSSSRRSFLGFGKKRQSSQPGLLASKWAPGNLSASAPSSPVTATSSSTVKEANTTASSMPASPSTSANRNSSSKLLRRKFKDNSTISDTATSQHLRANTIGTSIPPSHHRIDPHGFPFPPPPIPEEYKFRSSDKDLERPRTSDGLVNIEADGKAKGEKFEDPIKEGRPGMAVKRASTASVPAGNHADEPSHEPSHEPDNSGHSAVAPSSAQIDGNGKGKNKRNGKRVVFSERTGRRKKFQGLRRVFGLDD